MKLFPGQVETTIFTLDQIKALASSVRSDVYWSFSPSIPMSVADVARSLGKSAQTVHYHTADLAQLGMLIVVGSRKKRSRTEKLYARSAIYSLAEPRETASEEYMSYSLKGFSALMRRLTRETEAFNRAVRDDHEMAPHGAFRMGLMRLKKDAAEKLQARFVEILEEADALETPDEGVLSHVIVYLRPTIGESRKRTKKR